MAKPATTLAIATAAAWPVALRVAGQRVSSSAVPSTQAQSAKETSRTSLVRSRGRVPALATSHENTNTPRPTARRTQGGLSCIQVAMVEGNTASVAPAVHEKRALPSKARRHSWVGGAEGIEVSLVEELDQGYARQPAWAITSEVMPSTGVGWQVTGRVGGSLVVGQPGSGWDSRRPQTLGSGSVRRKKRLDGQLGDCGVVRGTEGRNRRDERQRAQGRA